MKLVIGCDVDPVLPAVLSKPLDNAVWKCLDAIAELRRALGADFPRMTWLIRSDESVRFATGQFDSGYTSRRELWDALAADGHELGWHFHLLSPAQGQFGFDAQPPWFEAAHAALAARISIRATRTGWDYGSNWLFQKLDALGIAVDFSALPGNIAWHRAGADTVTVNWLNSPGIPFRPSTADYRKRGELNLLEIPIAQFANSAAGMAKRMAWRLKHGCFSVFGLKNKTKMLTEPWDALPCSTGPIWAFYFHPEDLGGGGLARCVENVRRLKALPDAEFLTASNARAACAGSIDAKPTWGRQNADQSA